MSKKFMKIPSIFFTKQSSLPWQWRPSCNHPKTLSFRASTAAHDGFLFKTVNSVFLHSSDGVDTPDSWFTNSSDCASTTADDHSEDSTAESLEMIMRGVRLSERLFFEPDGETSSIVKESKDTSDVAGGGGSSAAEEAEALPFEESVALAMESEDPYLDFRRSMEEMVESHGLKDWDCLEELLRWYLRMNGKMNHGFIVGAFVDMLVGMGRGDDSSSTAAAAEAASCSESTSYSSAESCFSSPPSPASISPNGPDQIIRGDAIIQS